MTRGERTRAAGGREAGALALDRGELATDRSEALACLKKAARHHRWVVYAKPPFGGPKQVLRYLSRYTHRVAISNRRLMALEGDRVAFTWRDRADGNRTKTAVLTVDSFLRRFLLHVLPKGFVRIRS